MDHFKTPLPYAVLAFSFIWDWVNKHFTETVSVFFNECNYTHTLVITPLILSLIQTMSIVLPNSVYQKLKSLRKDDKGNRLLCFVYIYSLFFRIPLTFMYSCIAVFFSELDGMCRVNSTALVHATISVLLAFLCITSDYSIWTNPINGKSSVFDILSM